MMYFAFCSIRSACIEMLGLNAQESKYSKASKSSKYWKKT